ncbi:MAG: hypothetical protein ABIV50_02600 [Opitutus sp.]
MSFSRSDKLRRGSVLITSLIFAAITGVALASYLALCRSSLQLANRSFYANSAMNVAEIGIEQTLACFNNIDNVGSPTAWPSAATAATTTLPAFSGWTLNSGTATATGTYSALTVGPNTLGSVKMYVHYYDGSGIYTPVIVAKSTVQTPNGRNLDKYIEVTLRKRSRYGYGLVAYGNISWSGVPSAKSWNSNPDNDTSTAAVPYTSIAQNTANVVVGSVNGNISLGSGTVYGYAKTGPGGTISGGTVQGLTGGEDASRRTDDFNATFPDPSLPTYDSSGAAVTTVSAAINGSSAVTGTVIASGSLKFGAGTGAPSQVIDGKTVYVYVFTGAGLINLNGSNTITMSGNCMFLMQGKSGTTAITINGSQGVIIPNNSSLTVYTDGNITMSGNSTVNNNPSPDSMLIKGTNPTSQTISIGGTADIKAVLDAPHAAVSLSGTQSFQGAVIANTINMNGTPDFIYDDSLAAITTGNPYGISKWKELQSNTERAAYSSSLNF